MSNTFGFGTDTTNFSDTVHEQIVKQVIDTLRAGLICLPRGAVVPAVLHSQAGETFQLRMTAYPDLLDEATTAPLTEGVAPTALLLAIDTMDFTVQQVGAWTKVTDIAQFQSPHPLLPIARDKIARLAVQSIDNLALAVLMAGEPDANPGTVLTTKMLLDAKAILQARDVEPISDGVGYYAITHPYALRGLEREDDLNGYIDVAKLANVGSLTKGVVSQYRGITFLTSSRIVADGSGNYPVFFVGANSIAFGDVSTISYHAWSAAGPGNELQQLAGVGYKGILGGKLIAMSETTDGAASTDAPVKRVYSIAVASGLNT